MAGLFVGFKTPTRWYLTDIDAKQMRCSSNRITASEFQRRRKTSIGAVSDKERGRQSLMAALKIFLFCRDAYRACVPAPSHCGDYASLLLHRSLRSSKNAGVLAWHFMVYR